jgi:hypothetical protein
MLLKITFIPKYYLVILQPFNAQCPVSTAAFCTWEYGHEFLGVSSEFWSCAAKQQGWIQHHLGPPCRFTRHQYLSNRSERMSRIIGAGVEIECYYNMNREYGFFVNTWCKLDVHTLRHAGRFFQTSKILAVPTRVQRYICSLRIWWRSLFRRFFLHPMAESISHKAWSLPTVSNLLTSVHVT